MQSHIKRRHALLGLMIVVFIGLLLLSVLLAVTIGAVKIPLGDVYRIVLYQSTHFRLGGMETGIRIGDIDFLTRGTMYEIVWNVRMPRVIMGAIIGVLLASCGVVMQATVENPLADPYILGISSGASLGATFSIMIGASTVFSGHRAEFVRELDGVKYYNDSIASSPTLTASGTLSLYDFKIILIAGGYDKHLDYTELGDVICRKVKLAILMGATADKIETAIRASKEYAENDPAIIRVANMDEAVQAARENAVAGDIVSMSPASASFDLYKDFDARGKHFKALVNAL